MKTFAIYANAGRLVTMMTAKTSKGAKRLAASIYGGATAYEVVNDGSGVAQLRSV